MLQPNLSASWLFQRAMSAKQHSNVPSDFINELLYVNFQSMQVHMFFWHSNVFLSQFVLIHGYKISEVGGYSA